MTFGWEPQQEELFKLAREVAQRELPRRPADPNGNGNGHPAHGQIDRDRWRRCAEFGLQGLCLPTELGGLGLDHQTTARVLEGFGQGTGDMGFVFSACAHLFACAVPICEFGSDELKGSVVPRLASGEWIGANAMTEAEAGSDVSRLQARAERDGDDYVITGDKTFVTNGPVADVAIVYATTDPGLGYMSLSAFVVELDRPGVIRGRPVTKIGLSGSPFGSLYFDGCRVPASQRIGQEGQGSLIFRGSMNAERACLFGAYVGNMQRQLDEVVAYASTRKQFGKPIGKNQAVSHRIADMQLRLEAARLLLYRACWLVDQGEDATFAVSLAKLAVSEAAVSSGLDAIRIHGGAGVVEETAVDQSLRDAIPATIFSGTSDIQREIVANRLGL
jgi:alkylation response protein AidB-like acyl-CoA dehydrogenase